MRKLNKEHPEWWIYIETKERGLKLGYEQLPYLDDYGLSYTLVNEYWDKLMLIKEKWWKRLDEEKLLLRLGFSFCLVSPIVIYITESFGIGFILFVIHCLGEYIFRKYMMRSFRKELKSVEIPMIEKYFNALWAWNKNKK